MYKEQICYEVRKEFQRVANVTPSIVFTEDSTNKRKRRVFGVAVPDYADNTHITKGQADAIVSAINKTFDGHPAKVRVRVLPRSKTDQWKVIKPGGNKYTRYAKIISVTCLMR